MAKINLVSALAEGVISTYQTSDENTCILVIGTIDKNFIIPMIKNSVGALAYIDTTKYGMEDYNTLRILIEDIFENSECYKNAKIYKYNPISASAPEHCHEIISYIKAIGGNENKNARDILKKEGYTFVEKTLKTVFVKKDYSELMKDPVNKEYFDKDAADLEKVGATYESLNLETKMAYESIEFGSSAGIIFEGPTGTGKSFAAKILANRAEAPLLNLQITYGTTVEDLVGMFTPCDDSIDLSSVQKDIHKLWETLASMKKSNEKETDEQFAERFNKGEQDAWRQTLEIVKATGGSAKWKFVMGPLLKAYVYGYQIVIEEINYGQPGVNAKLNEFTDGTTRVCVNGQVYDKHPNFVVYMTMNPGYAGTEPLNVALKNRFAKVNVPALTKTEFSNRMVGYSTGLGHTLSYDFFSRLYDFSSFIEKEGSSSKWHENIKFSIRNAQRVCEPILQKKRNFNEFTAFIAIQYLNDLSADNDNSDKLESFKKDKDIIEMIRGIYELYDFAESNPVKVNKTWSEFLAEEETPEHKSKKDSIVDELVGRFAGL